MQNPSSDMRSVFFALCKSVDTPQSLGAWLRFKYDDPSFLDLAIRPANYNSADSFSADYLIVSFLSKYKGHDFGVDTAQVALGKFTQAEFKCLLTNRRFSAEASSTVIRGRVDRILSSARRKIASVLGPFDIVKVNEDCRWGPGTTHGLNRKSCTVDNKLSKLPMTVTAGSVGLMRAHIESDPHWFAAIIEGEPPVGPFCLLPSCFQIIDSNKVVTVPKNAKTDRTIAAEPTGNSFLQQGVGRFIRRRLRSVGIDLDNQSTNQVWASLAHDLGLATLDLSAASDTIAKELVSWLLPIDWFIYLDRIRSHFGLLPDGSRVRYQKFSSMGNAFTFELETLIFWALCRSVVDEEIGRGIVSAYGDDLIVPQTCAQAVVEVLEFCGFSTNVDKSYTSGRFFESCGKHYFDGFDVTPVFQKEVLFDRSRTILYRGRSGSGRPKDVRTSTDQYIKCANRLRRWALRAGFEVTLDARVHNAWLCLRRHAIQVDKDSHDYRLPLGSEGDGGWLLSMSEWSGPSSLQYTANKGYRCRVMRQVPLKRQARESAILAYTIRTSSSTPASVGYDVGPRSPEVDMRPTSRSPFDGSVSPRTTTVRMAMGRMWLHATRHFDVN